MAYLPDRQWLVDHPTLVLSAGLGHVLLLATAIGRALALVQGDTPTIDFGLTGTVILFALLSFWALHEFLTLTLTRHGNHSSLLQLFLEQRGGRVGCAGTVTTPRARTHVRT